MTILCEAFYHTLQLLQAVFADGRLHGGFGAYRQSQSAVCMLWHMKVLCQMLALHLLSHRSND